LRSFPSGSLFVENVEVTDLLFSCVKTQSAVATSYMVGTLVAMDSNSWSAFTAGEAQSVWMSVRAFYNAVSTFLECDTTVWEFMSEEERALIENVPSECDTDVFEGTLIDEDIVEAAKGFITGIGSNLY
jgi:hypothetical protein